MFYGGLKNSKGELIFSGQALGNPLPALRSNPAITTSPTRCESGRTRTRTTTGKPSISIATCRSSTRRSASWTRSIRTQAFKAHGGKLFLYAGWGDTTITPENTVLYYESVLNKMGKSQGDWMRLFMVPGMAHCRGGRAGHLRLDRHARSVARERRRAGAAHRGERAGSACRVRSARIRSMRSTREPAISRMPRTGRARLRSFHWDGFAELKVWNWAVEGEKSSR